MTIKHLGGVFGRNPTFNDVTIEGTLTFDGAVDITTDLTIDGVLTANGLVIDTDTLYVDSSNDRVGIGTSSPEHSLHLFDSGSSSAGTMKIGGSAASLGLEISYSQAGSTSASIFANPTYTNDGALLKIGVDGDRNADHLVLDGRGNVLVGGSVTPASAQAALALFNGTAPTGSVTNGIVLYAEDVSASSELKVRDEAGNVTTLSPHNFELIPEGPSEDMAWSYYSEKDGKRINVDMLKAIRVLEKMSGEQLVYED